MLEAEIITVGDELLIGQVANTNAAWLGEKLTHIGCDIHGSITVGDDEMRIQKVVTRALKEVDLVVITGGLGPTHDDVTRNAVARVYDAELRFDENVFRQISERFARRGVRMPASNRLQALVPDGFEVLPNPVGTAPGLLVEREFYGKSRLLAALPGVPHEMKMLTEVHLLRRIEQRAGRRVIRHLTLRTAGAGESAVAERLGDLSNWLDRDLRLAFLPDSGNVLLRITASGADEPEVQNRLTAFESHIKSQLGTLIYGYDREDLETVVGRILTERGITVAIAESCTGGNVVHRLTNVPGASTYVTGAIVAYCNEVKVSMLDVDPEVLETLGAVSGEVAIQMARGIRNRMRTDIGISTTGIAGPTGGTEDKPVGTVWIGYADADHVEAVKLRLVEDRIINKELTAVHAMNMMRKRIEKLEPQAS